MKHASSLVRHQFRLAFRAARLDCGIQGVPGHIAQAACDVDREEMEAVAFVNRCPYRVNGKGKHKAVYAAQDAYLAAQWARHDEKKGAFAA